MTDAEVEAAIVTLLAAREPGRTICPSEAARALAADETAWRALMPAVRAAAARLQQRGLIQVTQRGQVVIPGAACGPIRLSRATPPRDG